ncbi:hypothetical protein [Ruegeria atlantica]|uniref:hypothetical protein n=1 Tax=Ruegeria atlantica TaxID=81569 RepID=UPI0020C2EC8B|nr:hypothetical protein [Ruegeria atlantica]
MILKICFETGFAIMRALKLTALAAVAVSPVFAQGIGVRIGAYPGFKTTVTPMDNGVYEVAVSGSSAPVSYWCGIGDFAISTLRTKATQRIYVVRAYEKGVRTVQFSLTPPEGVDTAPSYSISVKRVGENMSAGSAQGYCWDNFMDFGFR